MAKRYVNVWYENGARTLVPEDQAPPYEERMRYAPADIKSGKWYGKEQAEMPVQVFEDDGVPDWGRK